MISTNSLFHFTNINHLLGILENNFFPRYSIEIFSNSIEQEHKIGFPMICFCDIPLSQIHTHIKTYGEYGIGLYKKWGIENHLNPVLYIENNSFLKKRFDYLMESNWDSVNSLPIEQLKNDRHALIFTYAHTKPYEGHQERNGILSKIRFYDEREWRYVLNIDWLGNEEIHLSEEYLTKEILAAKNFELQEYPLLFMPRDIQYIIISKESERLNMINSIRQIKSRKYNEDEIKILASKILSVEQIVSDI